MKSLCIHLILHFKAVTFPECVEKFLQDCLNAINSQVAALGLATLEIIVREKRNLNQPGYNKVVIITNELADRVKGRAGDGYVNYPFLWDDVERGLRSLGVDGKWNCVDITPEACCEDIKKSMYSIFPTSLIVLHLSIPMMYLIDYVPSTLGTGRRFQYRYKRKLRRVSHLCPVWGSWQSQEKRSSFRRSIA